MDEQELEVPRDVRATVRRLWREAKSQHWRFAIVVCSVACYVSLSIAAPAYSAHVVDLLWGNIQAAWAAGVPFSITWETGGAQVLIFLGLWTAAWAFYSLQCFVMAGFAERLNLRLRTLLSAKLSRLPLSFFDAHQPGQVISRATNDLDKMSEVLQRGVLQLITAVGMVVGSVAMMASYSLLLTGAFLAFALLSTLVTKVVANKTLVLAAERQRAVGTLTGAVEEAYSGRAIIKAFNREGESAARVHAATQDVADAARRADFMTNAINPAIRFVMRLAQVIIAVLAGMLLIQGNLTVGQFQAYFQYVNQAGEPLTQLSFVINSLQSALASVERVFDLIDEPEIEPDPALPAAVVEPVRGRVEFSHVRFGYDPERPLMRDVSFVAEPGQKVAIVGATGAGKTTLINLLMRFYEVDGGRILLDGVDTRMMARADLRREFGMVLQDAWLFDGTIEENIAYGRPGAGHDEVVEAARTAHVDFFVRTMSQGYRTHLADDAENVSQGQRQLLTIARVILRDPAILILDEATSSVDTRTEQAIVHAMEALMAGRTSFVIAHRLSTVVDADLILVMDHGTIIEQGTHAELLAAGGAYAELYRSQFA